MKRLLLLVVIIAGCSKTTTQPAAVAPSKKLADVRYQGVLLSDWAAQYRDLDASTWHNAHTALVAIGQDAVPVFVQTLQSGAPDRKQYAAIGLYQIGPAARAALPALRLAQKDPDLQSDSDRLDVLQAIGAIEGWLPRPDDPQRKAKLEAIIKNDPDADKQALAKRHLQ